MEKTTKATPDLLKALQAHLAASWGMKATLASPDEAGAEFVRNALSRAVPALEKVGLPARDVTTVIVRGNGSANGHACLVEGRPVAWFAAEGYPTQARADAFVPHELIHAVHYSLSPGYAFDTTGQKNESGRQLVTEGVATALTASSMGISIEEALWGDAMRPETVRQWMGAIEDALPGRAASLIENWDKDAGELFHANDPTDPFRYRAGYAIGAKAAMRVMEKRALSPLALLSLSRPTLDGWIKEALA